MSHVWTSILHDRLPNASTQRPLAAGTDVRDIIFQLVFLRCRTVTQRTRTADLLRLGLLMALTMTLHNLPEGFAVGRSQNCSPSQSLASHVPQ